MRKLPKPRISILSPDFSAPMTESKMVSTMVSLSRRVRSPSFVTSSTRSAFVIVGVAPIGVCPLSNIVDAISLACKVKDLRDFRPDLTPSLIPAACGPQPAGNPRQPSSLPKEIEPGVPLHQFARLVDQIVGVRNQIPESLVPNLGFDDAGLARNPHRLRGFQQRVAKTARLVDQVQRQRLLAGPNLSRSQRLDIPGGQMTAVRNIRDELPVHVVDQPLEIDPFLRRHGVRRITGVFQRAGMDDFRLQLGPREQIAVVGPLHDDADGTDHAGVVGVDFARRRGNVVCAAGPHALNRGNHRLLLFIANAQHFVVNLLRSRCPAARRVDVQNDGLDGAVLIVLTKLVDRGIGRKDFDIYVDNADVVVAEGSESVVLAAEGARGGIHEQRSDHQKRQYKAAANNEPYPYPAPAWRRNRGGRGLLSAGNRCKWLFHKAEFSTGQTLIGAWPLRRNGRMMATTSPVQLESFCDCGRL